MPDWTINTLEIIGSDRDRVKDMLVNKDGRVDFNLLAPMPESLGIDANYMNVELVTLGILRGEIDSEHKPSSYRQCVRMLTDNGRIKAPTPEQAAAMLGYEGDRARKFIETYPKVVHNCNEHGHPDWYEWALDNWGVKWNPAASDPTSAMIETVEDDGETLTIVFSTAWQEPLGIIEALRKRIEDGRLDAMIDWEIEYADGEMRQLYIGGDLPDAESRCGVEP